MNIKEAREINARTTDSDFKQAFAAGFLEAAEKMRPLVDKLETIDAEIGGMFIFVSGEETTIRDYLELSKTLADYKASVEGEGK